MVYTLQEGFTAAPAMEMVAVEEVERIGEDLTPPLSPLSFSLHDSFLHSHCSSCFSPLPPEPFDSLNLLYCSPFCSSTDSPLHLSSASYHLLLQNPANLFDGDTSDLRAALLFLFRIKENPVTVYDRICGLMSNREKLLMSIDKEEDDEYSTRIRRGAKAMAAARKMKNGGFDFEMSEEDDCVLEEAVLCVVLTNAVEVQDNVGRSVGIAVYDTAFSWINHSCSPNACYRFLPPASRCGGLRSLITPATMDGCQSIEFSRNHIFLKGWEGRGPRITLRSIKPIKKGEEVTIAYTDLLQPKELRLSDLWLKYRFTCCCRRCVSVPPTYVDQSLQGISGFAVDSSNLNSIGRFCHDEEIEKLTESIDDAISDYLSSGDAESCCEKLENALINGLHDEYSDKQLKIRLHPRHYLSLSAYTTLASAYKVRSIDLLAESSDKDKDQLHVLRMSRFSAAYSLLLAILTHHLFLFESSLIASVANLWIGAGESLLNLAKILKMEAASELPSFPSYKCSKCTLCYAFDADFHHGQAPNRMLDISKEFLNCITDVTSKVWRSLVHDNCYLGVIEDPIDLRWLETNDMCGVNGTACKCQEWYEAKERVDLFHIGSHCLLYGGILSNVYGGQDSYLSCSVCHLLSDGGTSSINYGKCKS